MKNGLILSVYLFLILGIIGRAEAQQNRKAAGAGHVTVAENKKVINFDAASIARASKIIERNKALFNDPQTLKKIIKLSQTLNKTNIR